MHILDVFTNGHKTLMQSLEGLLAENSDQPGVCGEWSVKDILIHITSFEHVLSDLLLALQGLALDSNQLHEFIDNPNFNEAMVQRDQHMTIDQVLFEYQQAHEWTVDLLAAFPENLRHVSGLIGWYGQDYDLEDFITYTYYGHKIEHSAQIAAFRDQTIADMAQLEHI